MDDVIVIKLKKKPASFEGLFASSQANKIALENLNSENVKAMTYMFLDCEFLKFLLNHLKFKMLLEIF